MNIGIVCYASVGGSGVVATELGKVGIGNQAELTLVNRGQSRTVLVIVSDIS